MPYTDPKKRGESDRARYKKKREQELLALGLDPSILSEGRSRVLTKPRSDTSIPAHLILEMAPRPGETKSDHKKRRDRLRQNYYNSLISPEERLKRNEKSRSDYIQNHEQVRLARNLAYAQEPERFREYNLRYFLKNKEKRLLKLKDWARKNPDRYKAALRKWAKENPEVFNASTARCRAQILRASPEWVDWIAIRKIYAKSANHNRTHPDDKWQVDHIIPLNNPDVCGLHVVTNLRIIPILENQRKGNRVNFELLEIEQMDFLRLNGLAKPT